MYCSHLVESAFLSFSSHVHIQHGARELSPGVYTAAQSLYSMEKATQVCIARLGQGVGYLGSQDDIHSCKVHIESMSIPTNAYL